jgi:penicillin-binding protein 1A
LTKRFFIRSLPVITTLIIGVIGGYIYWCLSTLPEIKLLEDYFPYEASKLYSYDNELLTEFYIQRRNFISHKSIPQHVRNSFIAVEDKRFYNHCGIDFVRTIGALLNNVKEKAFVEGGSTITQQLAKMVFLTPEKTITRKLKEAVLSIQLERRYTKDEILGIYLNQVYLGTRAYGIEAAAQTYFGKSTENITISETALLATLPKAPSKHSPFKDPKMAIKRRNSALKKMLLIGFINKEQYQDALDDPLPEKLHGRKYKAPYFVDYLRNILEDKFGDRLYTSGLKIYTTLDYNIQMTAEMAVSKGIEEFKQRGVEGVQVALIAADLNTGRIKAMVGGTNYNETQFNRATQAKRQPGSAFKPIVYLAALNQGFTPDDIITDKKFRYIRKEGIWVPQNYGGVYLGKVSLQKALSRSLNAATVNLAKRIGIKSVIKTAKTLGIKSTIKPLYPSALGASELTLLEIVYAYAAFNNGYRVKPVCIDRVIDREQLFIMEPSNHQERVIDETVVANMKDMLRSVILEGTGRRAKVLNREVYGKTGTSNDHADAWFIGFDDKIVAGVWVGRDDRRKIGIK